MAYFNLSCIFLANIIRLISLLMFLCIVLKNLQKSLTVKYVCTSKLSILRLKRGAVCKGFLMNRFRNSEVLFHCQSHKVSFERYLPTCLIIKLSPELSISWVVKSHSRSHRLLLYVNGKANKKGTAFSSDIAFVCHPK